MKKARKVLAEVRKTPASNNWEKAVKKYAEELVTHWVEDLTNYGEANNLKQLNRILLNGADDWTHYSYSGCALCFDESIADRFLGKRRKKTGGTTPPPAPHCSWFDVQALALTQAELLIISIWAKG